MVKSQGGERVSTTPHSYLRNKVFAYKSFYLLCPLLYATAYAHCAQELVLAIPLNARESLYLLCAELIPTIPLTAREDLYPLYARAYTYSLLPFTAREGLYPLYARAYTHYPSPRARACTHCTRELALTIPHCT
jgi:hypothetical protein